MNLEVCWQVLVSGERNSPGEQRDSFVFVGETAAENKQEAEAV